MPYQAQSAGAFLKGLVASNQPLAQPKGSFPRGSNLVMLERGALTPCDGSGIINWFNGAVQTSSGRFMSLFLFEPTGVNPYYLAIKQALDEHLGAPHAVSIADSGAGGSLGAGTYHYEVTALDGVGGETVASNELTQIIAANHKITLVWNTVPNAFAYNIYRTSGASGTEVLLAGSITAPLPVIQPATATVTFVDDGTTTNAVGPAFTILTAGGGSGTNQAELSLTTQPATSLIGRQGSISGNTNSYFNANISILSIGFDAMVVMLGFSSTPQFGSGGTVSLSVTPPTSGGGGAGDTTQQTALFLMPAGTIPVTYSDANIVALYPASLGALGQVPTGASGGQGTTGPGINGRGNSTPSGGISGLVGPLPQFKQFTNRAIIALGNGFPMQLFSDPTGSAVNPALNTLPITSVSVTADVVTVSTSFTLTAFNLPPGSNVLLFNMSDPSYDGVFPVISVNTGAGTFKIRNPNASGGASTGFFTIETTPIVTSANTFTPSFPVWTATTAVAVGDIYVPKTQPGGANIYIIATQAGITAAAEPTWQVVAATGQSFPTGNIADGQGVIWQEAGYLSAPSPPGAGHIEIYAGSLWAFNTSPTNTANGLDGPTALRMSNVNDPNGWNSVNQAFLDKDDGAEGMGMGKFTITALGIPPEGSLIAFKYRVPYQIIGVFGANNFAIQPVSSDMGCLAPRTIQFVPGYGLMRYCHLGIGVFNGFKDEVISEQIRPFLFPVNDFDTRDITVVDANYIPLSWAAQTANPPMYAMAAPIGSSGGQLTRLFLFDLILKCWAANADLPFPIGCISQVQPVTSNPLTIIGGFNDGALQRWQAGDVQWYTGGGNSAVNVAWSMRTITVASQTASQRLWARKLIVRGTNAGAAGEITVQPRLSTVAQPAVQYPIPGLGDFDLFADVGLTGLRFDALISGNLHVEIDGIDWAIEPRPFGVPVAAI